MKLLLLLPLVLSCTTNSDCARLHECHNGSCSHKGVFPLTGLEVVGSVLFVLFLACGIAAGIGGGLMIFPVLLTLFNFGPHESIPIINTTAVCASFVAYLQRAHLRRPHSNEPMTDYEIVTLIFSAGTLGTVYGVMLNVAFPQWLLVLFITALLGALFVKTISLGLRQYRKENEHSEQLLTTRSTLPASLLPLGPVPSMQLSALFGQFLLFLCFIALAGGRRTKSLVGIEMCSWAYFLVFASYHVVTFGVTWSIARHLLRKSEVSEGSLAWSRRAVFVLPLFAFLAGMFGAMLLVGLGLVLSPVLLSFRVDPQIVSATLLFSVFVSGLTTTTQFYFAGVLNLEYSLYFDVLSALSALLGVVFVKWVVSRYRRTSIIVFLLAGVVALSFVTTPVYESYQVIRSLEDGSFEGGFHSACS